MEMQKMKLVVVGNGIDASTPSRGPGAFPGMRPVRVGKDSVPALAMPRYRVH
jgi:hypothetical protein